jgi:hypothetical protein
MKVMSRETRVWCVLLVFSVVTMTTLVLDASSDACLSQMRAPVSQVTLLLVDRVGLPRDAHSELMKETSQLWDAAGVEVTWSRLPPAGTKESTEISVRNASHPHVTVIVRPDMPDDLRSQLASARVMASILFVNDRPTSLIAAYPSEVQRLLETVRMDVRPVGERPAAYRHRMMGRVLGRAIAHELGHFLFGSSDHAPDGLMRATHRLDDLTSPFRRAFRVMPAQPLACDGITLAQRSSPSPVR